MMASHGELKSEKNLSSATNSKIEKIDVDFFITDQDLKKSEDEPFEFHFVTCRMKRHLSTHKFIDIDDLDKLFDKAHDLWGDKLNEMYGSWFSVDTKIIWQDNLGNQVCFDSEEDLLKGFHTIYTADEPIRLQIIQTTNFPPEFE